MLNSTGTRSGVPRPAPPRLGAGRAVRIPADRGIGCDSDRRKEWAKPGRMMTSRNHTTPHTPIDAPDASWYAVWTARRRERAVEEDLAARGFETFLPQAFTWVRRHDRRRRALTPLFPGYLFLRHALDDRSHAAVLRAPGVVRLLGDGPRPTPVGTGEIEAVRRLAASGLPLSPRQAPVAGDRVRIVAGPLAGLEGRFLRSRPTRGLFILAVTLLRRAVAVEVDAALVEVV
jgi:transcription antitermination factor NusG